MNSTKSKAIGKTFEGLVNILMLLAFALVVITGVGVGWGDYGGGPWGQKMGCGVVVGGLGVE